MHSARAADGYARVSNKELQSRALNLVKNLRELVYAFNKKDKQMLSEYNSEYLATRTTERQAVRDRWRNKSADALNSSVREYQQKLLPECLAVREEVARRLPPRLRRPEVLKLYKNPGNVLAIDIVADDLELLAKSLPDG